MERDTTSIRVPSEGGDNKSGDTPKQAPGPNPEAADKKQEVVSSWENLLKLNAKA